MFGANGAIQRIRTSVVISRVKSTASVPIEATE